MFSIEFWLTSLVVVLMPGTGVIYTVSNGLFCGARASVAAAFGCTLGIVPHLAASVLGLSAILHMSSVAFQVMKYAGGLYLLFLAYQMWKETGGIVLPENQQKRSMQKVIVRGFLINILNPKLSLFFLAFLPLFIQENGMVAPIFQLLGMSGAFMGLTFGVFILYGLSSHMVSRYVTGSPGIVSRIQKSFALLFAVFGIKLMTTEQ